jgi:Rod binding domain-containing protein
MKIDLTPGANIKPLRTTSVTAQQQLEGAEAVRDTFRQFVGETFFKQMLKSMRSTQNKPAYFHGGHAEEVFQSQLDQVLAEKMTTASADQFADPMFRLQFPQQAQLLDQAAKQSATGLGELENLRRW